jgi:hypothetical protein
VWTAGGHHPGVLVALSSRFSRRPGGIGAIGAAVHTVADQHLELTKFRNPTATTAESNAPANTFGQRRIVFAVDIDDVIARMRARGAEARR